MEIQKDYLLISLTNKYNNIAHIDTNDDDENCFIIENKRRIKVLTSFEPMTHEIKLVFLYIYIQQVSLLFLLDGKITFLLLILYL